MSTSDQTVDTDRPEAVAQLDRARERLESVEERIDDHGEDRVETAAEAYRNATRLLETYVDRATGTGRENFANYVRLEAQFSTLVENLPEDLEGREAFEAALEAIDKRRLNESDFERAEAALEPAATFAELLEEREAAREALTETRKVATRRLRELEDEIDERERLLELGDADLEAPVDRLREPIESYNATVREAFETYLRSASAREVFALLERAEWYPLVPFESPPEELSAYVEGDPAGNRPIPELLEYAEYSRSKLSHLVENADTLKRTVATRRTYLDGIDAEALTVDWPPPSAAELRYRVRELRPLVARIAGEDAVAALRSIRALAEEPEYERLRAAAVVTTQLTDDERERLAAGRIEEELTELSTEREAIREALEGED